MNISAAASTSDRILKSPRRITKSPSITPRTRTIYSNKREDREEAEETATSGTNTSVENTTYTPYKRKYTPSPLSSPVRQPASTLSRSKAFIIEDERIAKSPSITPRARAIYSNKREDREEDEETATSGTNTSVENSTYTQYKRKYTLSPLSSPVRQPVSTLSRSEAIIIEDERIAKSPSITPRTRNIYSNKRDDREEDEETATSGTYTSVENSTYTPYKRKYTPSPPPVRQPASTLSRSEAFIIEYDNNDATSTRWTKEHWKKLEQYYIDRNRDYKKAASAFYYRESLINIELPHRPDGREPETKELWSKEQIIWRCQCLDTSAKSHNGLLPSEIKIAKKRRIQ